METIFYIPLNTAKYTENISNDSLIQMPNYMKYHFDLYWLMNTLWIFQKKCHVNLEGIHHQKIERLYYVCIAKSTPWMQQWDLET